MNENQIYDSESSFAILVSDFISMSKEENALGCTVAPSE